MAEDTLLSKSLVDNADAASMRDPFVRAQQQYQERLGQGDVLSSSPMKSPNSEPITSDKPVETSMLFVPGTPQDLNAFSASAIPKAVEKLGVDSKNLAMNPLGKIQLIGRLKQKFGDSYASSPDVMQVLKLFDEHIKKLGATDIGKEAVSNGQRTLAAVLGR